MSGFTTFALILLLITISCRKHKSDLEKLPAATQSGAGTFGCLVNGTFFKPKGSPFAGPILSCAYQLKARQDAGEQTFSVGVFTVSVAISQGATIKLAAYGKRGTSYGSHGRYHVGSSGHLYYTDPNGSGELHITRFDEATRIVSGTFWFDGVNELGEKVQVRQGRFGLHYTL